MNFYNARCFYACHIRAHWWPCFAWHGRETQQGRAIQICGQLMRDGIPSSPTTTICPFKIHNTWCNWHNAVISRMTVRNTVCVEGGTLMSFYVVSKTLLLDFHLQDTGRSGDREIWHNIKEIIQKWSGQICTMSWVVLLRPSVGSSRQQQTEFPNSAYFTKIGMNLITQTFGRDLHEKKGRGVQRGWNSISMIHHGDWLCLNLKVVNSMHIRATHFLYIHLV